MHKTWSTYGPVKVQMSFTYVLWSYHWSSPNLSSFSRVILTQKRPFLYFISHNLLTKACKKFKNQHFSQGCVFSYLDTATTSLLHSWCRFLFLNTILMTVWKYVIITTQFKIPSFVFQYLTQYCILNINKEHIKKKKSSYLQLKWKNTHWYMYIHS